MSKKKQNLSEITNLPPKNSGKKVKIGIVVSEWNEEITENLFAACMETLIKFGSKRKHIKTLHVPGTFELVYGASKLIKENKLDGVICLGCVIKGETSHNEYINHAVAQGLINLTIKNNKPFIFGVLTPNNYSQALDRSGGSYGNKGTEAALTILKTLVNN